MTLRLAWRGPLDSCNYACAYCPFAKRPAQRRVLERDRLALARFVAWVVAAERPLEVLFTPYGEALIWPWYQEVLVRLSHLPHVEQVAIQTNGSGPTTFLAEASAKLALWVSWHPSEVERPVFRDRMLALHERGVRLSVGAVALPEQAEALAALRAELPPAVPMWLNAEKPGRRYDAAAIEAWSRIDPDFGLEARPHVSRGEMCRSGEDSLTVDGDGTVRRCVLIPTVLGNLYTDPLDSLLRPRPCTRAKCDCWLGYSHLPRLGLEARYGTGFLARRRTGG